jgi:hypothetical protein
VTAVTGWAIRGALAMGWWAPLIVLGTAGAAVMGVVKLGAWLWGLSWRQGRRRAKIRARHQARVRAAQEEAQRKFIEVLEREWEK